MSLVAGIGGSLTKKGWRLATGESLTAGLLAASLTAEPGASAWFAGGVAAYTEEAKCALLAVPAATIAEHGVVSAEVALAMAKGAASAYGTEVGVALSGVAGPGPKGGVQAGLVWLALCLPSGEEQRRLTLRGDRTAIREGAVRAALEALAEALC
ncbi:CinA family protein [bacterium]|nr:CinA family protein [bacterium]